MKSIKVESPPSSSEPATPNTPTHLVFTEVQALKISLSPNSASQESPASVTSLTDAFSALVLHRGLKVGSKKYRKARNEYIVNEWEGYFGEETKLGNWQKLCRDVGVEHHVDLGSITKCRKALRTIWVNIWDLLDAVKTGQFPVERWASQGQLAAYTKRTGKFYPRAAAKKGGPVKDLLAHIS